MQADLIDLTSLSQLCRTWAEQARQAARPLANASGASKNHWLLCSAAAIETRSDEILTANAEDVMAGPELGLNAAAIDRLTLTRARLAQIAQSLREVAALPDPVGETITATRRPNGLEVSQVRVPLGVIFMIYESRPNVTVDAAALCVKSGNAVILRGGKEASRSNQALGRILVDELTASDLPRHAVQLVSTTDRAAVGHLLSLPDLIDLAIPRGGESLIRRVASEAKMPVLKHYDGICHLYVDAGADLAMATSIIINSKVQRPGVCNAVETVLVHESIAPTLLPSLAEEFAIREVAVRGDTATLRWMPAASLASPADWDTEYLDLIVSIRVVPDMDTALQHIARHGSKHTDGIITSDLTNAQRFVREIDTAAVVVNASTRFNDGGQLGLGAEIGISTDKFHARGPCGLRELTTTQWRVFGSGQIRT